MQTERIQIAVRPRGGWEAIDLGFRMARSWWRPIFAAWLALVVPVFCVLNVVLIDHLWLAALIFWWLKPAFDRAPLYVLSESLFGHVPNLGETLRALPAALRPGLLRTLTIARLSPLRAVTLPVTQLEGLAGSARRERARLLIGRESSIGVGLWFCCIAFEWGVVLFGLVSLFWLVLPESLGPGVGALLGGLLEGGSGTWLSWVRNVIFALAMSAIEPFYVAGGFSIYINRRVYLEGWDIDLVFRKLVRRVASAREAGRSGVVAGLLLLSFALSGSAAAQADACAAGQPQDARRCIDRVLSHPDFKTTDEIEIWAPKRDLESDEAELPDFSWGVGGFLAALFQTLVWVALAVFAVVLIGFALRMGSPAARERPPERAPPEILFGLDVRAGSLPEDVIAAALARWAERDAIGALSLLYRGALVYLVSARGLEVSASATEGECTRLARQAVEAPLSDAFDALTRAWLYCAYGERTPDDADFRALCERWQPHLGVSP